MWTVKITDRTGVRDKKNNESNKTMDVPDFHDPQIKYQYFTIPEIQQYALATRGGNNGRDNIKNKRTG